MPTAPLDCWEGWSAPNHPGWLPGGKLSPLTSLGTTATTGGTATGILVSCRHPRYSMVIHLCSARDRLQNVGRWQGEDTSLTRAHWEPARPHDNSLRLMAAGRASVVALLRHEPFEQPPSLSQDLSRNPVKGFRLWPMWFS